MSYNINESFVETLPDNKNSFDTNINISDRKGYNKFIKRANYQRDEEDVDLVVNTEPMSHRISMDTIDLSRSSVLPVIREDVDYPCFSLGFTHWMHASKNKTEIFDTFKGKKRVYHVVNPYERYVDEYKENMGNVSQNYFGLNKQPNILSRAFYKLWELIYYYNLIDIKSRTFKSAHLAEGPGSFIQATMFFRDRFSSGSKTDKYYAVTIHSEDEDSVPELEKKFISYYGNEKPQRFYMHKTYNKQIAGGSRTKDNGDLTNTKTINNFKKEIKDKVDLVTGDGGFNWTNENIQEQECAILIYGQIVTAINIQKKGGNFVLKVYEMFTKLSAKFIILLKYFYDEVYINKPLTSRSSNSERYLVCKNFKFNEKDITGLVKQMMDSLDVMTDAYSRNIKFVTDIFPDISIPNKLSLDLITINTKIANQQFRVINKMITFINGSNYFGVQYGQYREKQITANKHWIDVFMNDNKEYNKASQKAVKLVNQSDKKQIEVYNNYKSSLLGYDIESKKERKISRSKVKGKAKVKSKSKKKKVKSKSTSKKKVKTKRKSKSKKKN